MSGGRNQNSFTESLANFFTPNDGYSYKDGTLTSDSTGDPYTGGTYATNYGYFGQADSAGTGTNYQNVTSDGEARNTGSSYTPPAIITPPPDAKNTGPMYTNPLIMGGIGFLSGGLPGLVSGAGIASIRRGRYDVPKIDNTQRSSNSDSDAALLARTSRFDPDNDDPYSDADIKERRKNRNLLGIVPKEDRIKGSYLKKGQGDKQFKMNMFGSSYEINPETGNSLAIEEDIKRKSMEGGDDEGIASVRSPAPITQPTTPTGDLPAASAESEFAKQQMVSPPVEWLIANGYPDTNPSYDAIVKYNTELRSGVASMAEGGDVEFALGGNEKDLINAAERAVRNGLQAQGMARGGELNLSDEDMIALAQYTQQYGVDALLGSGGLVDSVRTGEADETRARFAMGRNGVVRGNGDGSGTDDKVPAKLKEGNSEQDVLLADGEFVLRKDAYEALKNAGVNVDKVNDAGSNAAKELNKMMVA